MKAAYAVLVYGFFLGIFLYLECFVEGAFVPRTLDAPDAAVGTPWAIAIDATWFMAFAVQHSVMARPAFKRRWTRLVPVGAERSTYVLVSSLMFVVLFAVWQPVPFVVWEVPSPAAYALFGLSFGGWGLAVAATFAIDHFELFGLRGPGAAPRLRTPRLYRWVRHPLYLGFLIAFWAAPVMTAGHLLFALGMTLYIAIGIHFEERDLVRTFGKDYVRYRERVPALLPWPRPGNLV